jgi:hypothetical protein
MTVTVLAACAYIADKCYAQFIKDNVYNRFVAYFWHKPKAKIALEQIVFDTIQEYRKTRPEIKGSIPFYLHKDIFEHLTTFVLFKSDSKTLLNDLFRKNPEVALPTKDEILEFFDEFVKRVNSDKRFRKLFIEDNHKEEIFKISGQITGLGEKLDRVIAALDTPYQLQLDFYVGRVADAEAKTNLEKDHLLLLSGVSFSGKSQVAKRLCLDYIAEGYTFETSDEIELCRPFLMKSKNKIIYLLDDPFGHVYGDDSASAWRKLTELAGQIPKQHRLIVTSRLEVLFQLNQTASLDGCSIGAYKWMDLTVKDDPFIKRYWTELCEYKQTPKAVERLLNDKLIQEELQPGQLNFLLNRPEEELTNKSAAELVLLAKYDSRMIANDLLGKGTVMQRLVIALGLSCDTIRPVNLNTLNFLLSETSPLPGLRPRGMKLMSFRSKGDKNPPTIPIYPAVHEQNGKIEALADLQMRGYVQLSAQLIWFSHSTYRDAASYVLLTNRVDINRMMLNLIERALGLVEDQNILIAVRQLEFIIKNRPDLREELLAKTIQIAKSTIFPSVESRLTEFITRELLSLSRQQQQDVLHLIQSRTSVSSVFWQNGTAFYHYDGQQHSSLFGFDDYSEQENYNELLAKINDAELLPAESIWQFVVDFGVQPNPIRLSERGVFWILDYPESFIRAAFAYRLFSKGMPTQKVYEKIFSDQHPEVVVEAIKGIFDGYLTYGRDERRIAEELIKKALHNPAVVIRSSNFFCSFGLDHASETLDWDILDKPAKQVLWALWAETFPIFFKHFPDFLNIPNSARFASNLRESTSFITAEQGLTIAEQFYFWIDGRTKFEMSIDAHDLGLVDFLFDSNPNYSLQRAEIFKKALNHTYTGFVGYALLQAAWHSSTLHQSEIDIMVAALSVKRIDQRWLHAIAITQSVVLPEVQQLLFGNPQFLDQSPAQIITQMRANLLEDALHVFTGKPQPLWWYATHHNGGETWDAIVKEIIRSEHEPGFEVCLRELLTDVINMPSKNWKDGQKIWKELCAGTRQLERIAKYLIAETAESNFNVPNTKELWKTIIDEFERRNALPIFLQMVLEYVEALQQYDHGDIIEILDDKIDDFIELLPSDKLVFQLAHQLEKRSLNQAIVKNRITAITTATDETPLKLKFSFILIDQIVTNHAAMYTELSVLKSLPDLIDSEGDKKRRSISDEYELPDWVHLSV